MQCKKCGALIPYRATMCQNCFQKTGHHLGERSVPTEDMFGNQVFIVKPDKQKEKVRENYLKTLPEFKELKEIRKASWMLVLKLFLLIFGSIFIMFFALAFSGLISTFSTELGVLFGIFSFVATMTVVTILFVQSIKKHKPAMQKEKTIKLHENKLHYYANDFVVGYSVLDHTSSDDNGTDYYYAFYEVDKRNIKGITYDSRYGEYVLVLYKPVFHHYDFRPCNEFRIADIFDDYVMSSVLACDLPPKHMPY